jgi:hypothetical protein
MNNKYNRTGFIGPFILGGITGGLVAPLFYNNRPYYNNYYPYPYYPIPYTYGTFKTYY